MKPKFFRKVLKNGMTIIFEKRDLPIVSVAIAVRNGGMNEHVSEKGISHFIEHMLYKGTPTRNAKKIAEEIERNGGILNGFTDESITAYWCKMPSRHLDVALAVLSDMVKNSLFDEKEMDKERKVIFEEIKMRKDNPVVYVFDKIQNYLYEAPLGLDLIGTEKTMSSIDRKKIIAKFKEVYKPNNMVLCVVGNTDLDKLINFAEKTFGNEKGKIPRFEVKTKNHEGIEKRKGLDQANLVFAWHTPLKNDKLSYASRVLSCILGGGMSSRLFSEIREKRNLAYSVRAQANIEKDFSYTFVYVGTTKENVEKVKSLIIEELEKVSKDLTEKELNEVKDQLLGNYQIAIEDSQDQMMSLLLYEMSGNAGEFYEFEEKIKAVKLEDVKELAKVKNYSFFALVPE